MHALIVFGAVLALGAQAAVMTALWRMARRSRDVVALSPDLARLHREWNQLLTQVYLAARDTVSLCPACHLGSGGPCACPQRRRSLAVALSAVEDFAASHATDGLSSPPAVGG